MKKAIVSALSLLTVAAAVAAGTDSTQFKVLLKITESCTISAKAPTDVDFGSQARITGTSTNYDAAGKLIVNCSDGTPWSIGLDGGVNSASLPATPTAGDRRMKHTTALPAVYVPYDLYKDSSRSTFWGNSGTALKAGTGTGLDQTIDVYGRLTDVNYPAGNYQDTITATVIY
ncbi:Csu type fimbrial protein [Ramlibacter humi]|nr:spore coat U domain-containing protein [Ramlibacter humi]